MMKPEIGDTHVLSDGSVITFTQVDYQLEEGRFKWYPSLKAVEQAHHDFSLAQFPKWHAENCQWCQASPAGGE